MAKLLAGHFFFVLVVAVGLWATPALSRELQDQLSMKDRHEKWMSTHGRIYKDDAQKARRFEIFKTNVEFIEAFNRDGDKSYTLGTNEFSDMTNEEFQAARNGYRKSPLRSSRSTPFKYGKVSAVPTSMDWRKKGAVTPVKDQQQCGKALE
ncbi:hypothetical protein MLD38_027563 [Melastoma candidum]|uniref:Uncharacterized protein n=1 Tax=Melastoma candidum TaxID=119954 RepID=A0ACB9P3Q6_9MYRT|nr:hypothetical protein MLD38_027563 [Melastoma candidum]